jgi:hypothetical protein
MKILDRAPYSRVEKIGLPLLRSYDIFLTP